MDISRMAKMAQEFVTSTSKIVGNRTINIMDANGTIIASSDSTRVGTFHEGALEVISSKKSVQIRASEKYRYKGAFEGCNMPIYYKGKIVGVVGINGEPKDVEDTANLLNVYVTQFFEQYTIDLRKQSEARVRKQIMNMYFSPYGISEEDLLRLEDVISMHLQLPCRVMIIDCNLNRNKSELNKITRLDRFSDVLLANKLINSQTDVYGIKDGQFVIIRSGVKRKTSEENYINELYKQCSKELNSEAKLVVGTPCNDIYEIAHSYKNARLFCEEKSGINLLDEPKNKEKLLLLYLINNKDNKFAREYYQKILEGLGESGLESAMITIETYYGYERSVTKAAAELCIHKNTLLYRINRILSVAGLEDESAFTQELLLKIVLNYYKHIKRDK